MLWQAGLCNPDSRGIVWSPSLLLPQVWVTPRTLNVCNDRPQYLLYKSIINLIPLQQMGIRDASSSMLHSSEGVWGGYAPPGGARCWTLLRTDTVHREVWVDERNCISVLSHKAAAPATLVNVHIITDVASRCVCRWEEAISVLSHKAAVPATLVNVHIITDVASRGVCRWQEAVFLSCHTRQLRLLPSWTCTSSPMLNELTALVCLKGVTVNGLLSAFHRKDWRERDGWFD